MQERPTRTLVKAASWQLAGLVSMTLIGYVMTGSFEFAGTFALVTMALGFVTYIIHERIWAHISWGLTKSDDGHSR